MNGDVDLASKIADVAEIQEFLAGETIIVQDNVDDDILFILAGRVSVVVNGREMAIRSTGHHVGEMSLINPGMTRSASVIALGQTVTARVSEEQFSPIADSHPEVWRRIAEAMSERLLQRNALVDVPNPRPVIFIGSSSEALATARAIQSEFQHDDYQVRVWTNKIFGASNAVIEDLENQVRTADFAILVLAPDDAVLSRKEGYEAPRDNVIFELGLFMGALTRQRTFFAVPIGMKDLKIPSDLLGVTPLSYKLGEPEDLPYSVGPMCDEIRKIIRKLKTK